MKKFFQKILILVVLVVSFKYIANCDILTIYNDEGAFGDNIYTWTDGGYFDDQNQEVTPPEGDKCFKTTCSASYAGWGVFYNSEKNFSQYQNGQLRFWIYSTTGNIKVEIERWNGETLTKYLTDYGWNNSYINTWKLFKIPLDDYAVDVTTSVKCPFKITVLNPATFYVDLVRWVTQDVTSPFFQIKVKDIETHIEKSSITFSDTNLPKRWVLAEQYIEIECDPDSTSWGIQIYTDNKSEQAEPKYTGSSDPCGLVDTTTGVFVLPMAWTIEYTTRTRTALINTNTGQPEPGSWVSSGGWMWKWMRDKNSSDFQNGMNYVVCWDNGGLLWGDWQRESKKSPNYIYLSANFSNAIGGRKYKTNQLKIEFFYK